jgi:hypothetical protein
MNFFLLKKKLDENVVDDNIGENEYLFFYDNVSNRIIVRQNNMLKDMIVTL